MAREAASAAGTSSVPRCPARKPAGEPSLRRDLIGRPSIGWIVLLLALASPTVALEINNGLAPPNPANVLNDLSTGGQTIRIRNVGCSGTGACASPGAATTVEVGPGASDLFVNVHDSSVLVANAGGSFMHSGAKLRDDASMTLNQGVFDAIELLDRSTIIMNGGVARNLVARNDSVVTFNSGTLADSFSGLFVTDQAHALVAGGDIWSAGFGGSSTGTITGGVIGDLSVGGSSVVDVFGGALGRVTLNGAGARSVFHGANVSVSDLNTGMDLGSFLGDLGPGFYGVIGDLAGSSIHFDLQVISGTASFVPEPATGLLLTAAMLGLTGWRRRLH